MSKVKVNAHIELDMNEILASLAQLTDSEFDAFAEQIIYLRAQRRAPHLSREEMALFEKINADISVAKRMRYNQLREKLEDETLAVEEHAELVVISDQLEMINAKRLEALIKLAEIRELPLDDLMDQLGLYPARHTSRRANGDATQPL